MKRIGEILSYLEEHIDEEHIAKVKERSKKALTYQNPDKPVLRICFPCDTFVGYPYDEVFNDMEKMMVSELVEYSNAADLKDDRIPMIRPNYGVGVLPSLFGIKSRVVGNNLPWVDHAESIDKIKDILNKGVPDIKSGMGGLIFDTIDYYREQLSGFPKCSRLIPIYQPDLQGPFDVVHLIWGSNVYYALYDEPELVHELLKLVTETYIVFLRELKKVINDEYDSFHYHWGILLPGHIVIRNDTAVNLSGEMYEEFVKPYDEILLREFGTGTIHYCGKAEQWIFSMMECENLRALNFGQPPNMDFGMEFLNKIYGKMKEKNLGIVNYELDKSIIQDIAKSEYILGVTYQTTVKNKKEAVELCKKLQI
jgi:uroporphyrinogen-III decarboxylase